MKEPYYEDLANHVDPAPNGGCGNTMADARVGESAGGLLSSEITVTRVPTSLPEREGHTDHSVPASAGKASCGRTLRSRRTWHARKPHERESGYPRGTQYSRDGIGESIRKKSPGALEVALDQCKPGTRRQGMNTGWAEEGVMPQVRFKKLLGSQTQHSTKEAGERKGTLSPLRSLWREGT